VYPVLTSVPGTQRIAPLRIGDVARWFPNARAEYRVFIGRKGSGVGGVGGLDAAGDNSRHVVELNADDTYEVRLFWRFHPRPRLTRTCSSNRGGISGTCLEVGLDTTFHTSRVTLRSRHQSMTASMVHVTNRLTPGSDNQNTLN
jgi:hypothetical protein